MTHFSVPRDTSLQLASAFQIIKEGHSNEFMEIFILFHTNYQQIKNYFKTPIIKSLFLTAIEI